GKSSAEQKKWISFFCRDGVSSAFYAKVTEKRVKCKGKAIFSFSISECKVSSVIAKVSPSRHKRNADFFCSALDFS
ncbi:MAG: hypothetical protein II681_08095, partial [Bacteroidaceae bacterium]|nr:hypothetical protein [Bacteroidaceae bacterium]